MKMFKFTNRKMRQSYALESEPVRGHSDFYPITERYNLHGKGGGGGETVSNDPWSGQQPYLQDIYQQASNLYGNFTPQYYPQSTVPPQSGYLTAAQDAFGSFAGSDYNQALVNQGYDVTSGLINASNPQQNPGLYFGSQIGQGATDYLNSFLNPTQPRSIDPNTQGLIDSYLNISNRNFQEQVLPQTQLNALQANAYGGSRQGVSEGIARRGLQETQDSTIANLLASQYNQDRTFGLNAANQAYNTLQGGFGQGLDALTRAGTLLPGIQQLPLQGYNSLLQAGQLDQAFLDAQTQDALQRYMYSQNVPYDSLQHYANTIYGSGSPGSQTTTPGTSPAAGAIGGALGGAGLANSLGVLGASNPYGWAIMGAGALLGSGVLD